MSSLRSSPTSRKFFFVFYYLEFSLHSADILTTRLPDDATAIQNNSTGNTDPLAPAQPPWDDFFAAWFHKNYDGHSREIGVPA